MQDNPYIVTLTPEEFHELMSVYQSYMESGDIQTQLTLQVLAKLQEADRTHICIDEGEAHEA